jgi:hypothetical protein
MASAAVPARRMRLRMTEKLPCSTEENGWVYALVPHAEERFGRSLHSGRPDKLNLAFQHVNGG